MRIAWTEQEINYLLDNWGRTSIDIIMDTLGRSQDSIIRKARRLGLNVCKLENEVLKKKWKEEEDQIIIEKYKILTPLEISQYLKRSVSAVKKRAVYLGAADKVIRWNVKEEEYLKEKWGISSVENIAKILKRSRNSIILKAYNMSLRDQINASGLFLTPNEVSEILNVNIRTLYSWMNCGLLKYRKFKVGSKIKYQISVDYFCDFIENYQDKWDSKKADIALIKSYYVNYAFGEEGKLTFRQQSTKWLEEKIKQDREQLRLIRRPWTTLEEKELLQMVRDGYTYLEISQKLGRSFSSTKTKIYLLRKKELAKFIQAV